ncbi:MAG: DinB family protein [Vicinamibacterales bacterium]
MTAAFETLQHQSAASTRAAQLADRLEQGARALIQMAAALSDQEWRTPLAGDGRPIGVVVHHVASVYPIEIQLAQTLAAGQPIVGVTMSDVHAMNAKHAMEHATVTKDEAIALLTANGGAAADAIRALTDSQLALAAPVSLYGGAPLTCQFVLEDHAVRHSYHHLARIRAALGK